MHQARQLAAALLVALICSSANAQWKWRDASGRVTASDLPPPATVPERDILSRPATTRRPGDAAGAAPRSAAAASATISTGKPVTAASTDPELEARRKRAADEQLAQQRQVQEHNDAARAENCNRARNYLSVLSDGKRVARTNAQGEVEPMDDRSRAEESQRARAMIASDCK